MLNSIPCGDLELNISHPHGIPTLVPSKALEHQLDWRLDAANDPEVKTQTLPTFAVHLHIHYLETLPTLLQALEACSPALLGMRLLISTNTSEKACTIEKIIQKSFVLEQAQAVTVRVCPNRGRNLGPLLHYLWPDLSKESLVLHLHGKRSLESNLGEEWLSKLLDRLLPDSQTVLAIRKHFNYNQRLGLLIPQAHEAVRPYLNWGNNFELASQLWEPIGGRLHRDAILVFPAGGMFWARPMALAPLSACLKKLGELPPEPIPVDATSLHAIERLIAHSCEFSGHRWSLLCESSQPNITSVQQFSVLQSKTEEFQQAGSFVAALCRDQDEQLECTKANLKRCTEQLNQQIISCAQQISSCDQQLKKADHTIRDLIDAANKSEDDLNKIKNSWWWRLRSTPKKLCEKICKHKKP